LVFYIFLFFSLLFHRLSLFHQPKQQQFKIYVTWLQKSWVLNLWSWSVSSIILVFNACYYSNWMMICIFLITCTPKLHDMNMYIFWLSLVSSLFWSSRCKTSFNCLWFYFCMILISWSVVSFSSIGVYYSVNVDLSHLEDGLYE